MRLNTFFSVLMYAELPVRDWFGYYGARRAIFKEGQVKGGESTGKEKREENDAVYISPLFKKLSILAKPLYSQYLI